METQHINLFCLPYAGGSKYSYAGLFRQMPPHIKVIPLDLPGRGERCREQLLTSIEKMAFDALEQIKPTLHQPYAIFGHSMGALVGYVVAKRIVEMNLQTPAHLFCSGYPATSVVLEGEQPLHALPRNAFFRKLKELGGSPQEVLENDQLMRFFEPVLRADFQAEESYSYQSTGPFGIPLTIMMGDADKITLSDALAWQQETTAKFNFKLYSGNHFYIFEHRQNIIDLIVKQLL